MAAAAFATQFSVRESFQCTSCTAFVSTGLRRLASRADNSSFWLAKLQKFQHSSKRQSLQDAIPGEPASIKMPEMRPARSLNHQNGFPSHFGQIWSAFLSAWCPTRYSAARFACSILIAAQGPAFEAPLRATSAPSTKTAVRRRPHAQHALRCSGARAARGERGDHRSVADPDRARARDGTK